MSEKDKGNLLAILDSCLKIKSFVKGISGPDTFFADEKTFDAVLMNFVVIGESVAKLSDELKLKESQVSWGEIKGFRNLIAHDYFGVDAEEVWQIIFEDLPELEKNVRAIME